MEAQEPGAPAAAPPEEDVTPALPVGRRRWRALRELLLTLVLCSGVVFGTRTVAQAREVLGPSMQPSYQQGQRVFISKYVFGAPARDDVIVFHPPVDTHDEYIKRVIGVPGDHIRIEGGQVYVNDRPLDEPFLHGVVTTCGGRWCDLTLGANQYYVLGDNRPNSSDSRFWGPVSGNSISGKVWLRFYPFSQIQASL